MPQNPTSTSSSLPGESLDDVAIRERQLQQHLLRSPEYLRRADQELKRQVTLLYLAIALLLLFQGLFAWRTAGQIPIALLLLTIATALLAVVNCVLLIRTKNCLRRLNDAWLKPEERSALETLRSRRHDILKKPTDP
jgi:Na+-translocating ferredoxin:NAD+ oxidoreductase RnfD subunit